MQVSLFVTCLADVFRPNVAISTVHILERLGIKVNFPQDQTCCGQVAFNAGFWDDARKVAKHFLNVFKNAEYIIAPSGSCVSMVKKNYPLLFEKDIELKQIVDKVSSRIYELTEFLVNILKVENLGSTYNGKVVYHDSCHLLRELGIRSEPRRLIQNIKGLELCEMKESEVCCGFGGVFSIKFPIISTAITQQKVECIRKSGANTIVATDLGCLLQIEGLLRRQRIPIKTMHIAELLDQESHRINSK